MNTTCPSPNGQIQECALEAAELGEACCSYQCMMSNLVSPTDSRVHCTDMAKAYSSCRQLKYYPTDSNHTIDFSDSIYDSYQRIGIGTSSFTIACCVIVIFIAVFLKSYRQWAEQVILSKTIFVLGFGLSLLFSFVEESCTDTLAATTSSFIVGDLLWTIVLLWVLKNTAKRPFQQMSFTKGILLYWAVVTTVCVSYGFGFGYFLYEYKVGGYMQYVPICLVSRLVAINSTVVGDKPANILASANIGLIGFVYSPYLLIFVVDILGVLYVWRRFSSSSAHASRLLSTTRKYLGWFAVYTVTLVVFYLAGLSIHSCSNSTYNWPSDSGIGPYLNYPGSNLTIQKCLKFPPPCVSWQGYECDSLYISRNKYQNVAQYFFFSLFCLRGVPDLLVFLYLNKARIIERIRNREYERTARSSIDNQRSEALLGSAGRGVQSLNIAHKLREDIMAYTQVHQRHPPSPYPLSPRCLHSQSFIHACPHPHPTLPPPPFHQAGIRSAAYSALDFHSQDKNNGRRSQTYKPEVPVKSVDFDETWVPLMTVAAEECRAQVPVKVEDVPSMNLGSSLSDFAFTDVAPKAFLQIRHAAGVSSREYADILGEALAATSVALLQ